MWSNPQFPVDLVTFIGEILNGKLHFFVLCLVCVCLLYLFTPFLSVFFVFHGKNLLLLKLISRYVTAWKVTKYGVFSGPYFLVFGLNTEIYGVNLRIQSEYRKIRTRKNSVFGHFSRSVWLLQASNFGKAETLWNSVE